MPKARLWAVPTISISNTAEDMKRPQRSFVVEIKSGRRQSAQRKTGIWGDIDLKSLSREVDDETLVGVPAKDPDQVAGTSDVEPVSIASEAVSRSGSEKTEAAARVPASTDDDPPADAAGGVSENKQVSTSLGQTPKARRKRISSSAILEDVTGRNDEVRDGAPSGEFSDELAALEIENRRLKSLLAEQLRAENAQLTAMLARAP